MEEKQMNKKFFTLLLFLVVLLSVIVAGCQTEVAQETMPEAEEQTEPVATEEVAIMNYIDVSPTEAKELIETKESLIVLDVSPKYAEGHLPGSINIYIDELEARVTELDPNSPVLVYCHVDSVSIRGAEVLIANGFKKVYRLAVNYAAWVDAGYDIEK
jgi:rhodanese-related sulfurtransferase